MFPRSTILEILWIAPLSVSFKFTVLLKNQVEWILPSVFNWRHLYGNCWFSWDILSLIKSLPENRNCVRSEDLSFKFFWLKRTFCLCLRHLDLTMIRFRFLKWWHECSCSGVTLTPVHSKKKTSSIHQFIPEIKQILEFQNLKGHNDIWTCAPNNYKVTFRFANHVSA